MTTFRDYLKRRAAMLEQVAQQKTEAVPVAELQAAAERNVAMAELKCEFCSPVPGVPCAVCNVLDAAELTA